MPVGPWDRIYISRTRVLWDVWGIDNHCRCRNFFYHLAQHSIADSTKESFSAKLTMGDKLESIIIAPTSNHTATVFLIHGLGDNGHGWTPVTDMFSKDSDLAHVKWVLPHSPRRSVTANLGNEMPSWFNIIAFGFDPDTAEDEDGMLTSVALIRQLIREEIQSGIDSSRIVLGGFSQGGAMSLLTALTSDFKLAGVFCLSGWLPLQHKFQSMINPDAMSTPTFWAQGTEDQLVRLEFSKQSAEILIQMGMVRGKLGDFGGLSYHLYDMGHLTNQKEREDLKVFIKKAVPVLRT